jgi:protein-S-isoprenylcysteine O-methyltransferase Ste14
VADWSLIAQRIRVPLGFAFAIVYVWLARPTWFFIIVGVIIAIPGIVLRSLASGHVKKNEELTTTGPYAYVRNPLYLGSSVMALGFAIAARSPWILLIMIAMFVAIYLPVIRHEEAYLREVFPNFEDYARNVPRLVPRWRAFGKGGAGFSSHLYWQHREYNAVLGTAAILAVLIAKLMWASR